MVTQIEVARKVGMDVSSVNKILNRVPGPVFSKDTIKLVETTARKMGYQFDRPHKGNLIGILRRLFPSTVEDVVLSNARGITVQEVRRIKTLLYKSAIALLIMRFLLPF